jgi:hypothetical protein
MLGLEVELSWAKARPNTEREVIAVAKRIIKLVEGGER